MACPWWRTRSRGGEAMLPRAARARGPATPRRVATGGVSDVRAVLISLAWTTGVLVTIIAWRRLVPAPMPRVFDFLLRTKFRRRTFSPEIAAERHGLAPGM